MKDLVLSHQHRLPEDTGRAIFFGLTQFATSNHITIRCVAQSMIEIIARHKERLRENYPQIGTVDTFSYLEAIDWYLKNNVECAKNLQKQHAHLSGLLDTRTTCSLSNLYYDIPVLEEINPSDTIPPRIFSELLSNTPVVVGSGWVVQASKNDPLISTDIAVPTGDVSGLNFQKKILPWANIELDDELSRNVVRTRKRQSLILVATLIDKIPNLAGMTRTSEIFNIEALVVPNKKVEHDTLFQQISVTAEKWVPLVEVKEDALANYLKEKKNEGYTLLGVEQTAQSTNLPDFNFPEKSVLLMGREKEGIPTEYINLLDRCIEIPQLGVVRSLNVHVSASILVWEYTRQQLIKK